MFKINHTKRRFVAYFHFVGWDCISLGLHVALSCPNIEIHLPFGFIRIGWIKPPKAYTTEELKKLLDKRVKGIKRFL